MKSVRYLGDSNSHLDESSSKSFESDDPFGEYTQSVDDTIERAGFGSNVIRELSELKVFKYVMVTKWDNILGPQLIKCWVQSTSAIDQKLINYVNMHVLSGDMDECSSSRDRERKLLFLPQQEIIILGIVFNVVYKSSRKSHCLSIVFPFTGSQNASRITNIRSFLYKSSRGIKDVIKTCRSGFVGPLNLIVLEREITNLDHVSDNLLRYSVDQVLRPLQYFGDGTSKHKLEFLKKVYQGTLQCAGFSLVCGRRTQMQAIEQASLMISYIIPAADRSLTVFPMANHTQFQSHIFHQALMYERDKSEILNQSNFVQQLGINTFPLAIIDVSKQEVFVTATLEKFYDKDSRQDLPVELKLIETYGPSIDKLVSRMSSFNNNAEFLKRIGNIGLTEIECKADVFCKLFEDHDLRSAKRIMKLDPCDSDIFIAWACRREPELNKRLSVRDKSCELHELGYVLG